MTAFQLIKDVVWDRVSNELLRAMANLLGEAPSDAIDTMSNDELVVHVIGTCRSEAHLRVVYETAKVIKDEVDADLDDDAKAEGVCYQCSRPFKADGSRADGCTCE
jgi:hypothetical protein